MKKQRREGAQPPGKRVGGTAVADDHMGIAEFSSLGEGTLEARIGLKIWKTEMEA